MLPGFFHRSAARVAVVLIGCAPLAASAAAPAPEVLLSLSGPVKGELESGMPLLVSVRIEAPAEDGAKLVLAPAGGGWSGATTVELMPARGGGTTLQATPVETASENAPLTLDAEQAAEGMWLFSSAGMARLPPGNYRVQVRLAIAAGAGWKGTATSEDAEVKIVPAAASTNPEGLDRRAMALANEAMATGDFPRAAQLLDERLTNNPDSVELLKTRAMLSLRGDNLSAANACVNRAWARVMREKWTHPPQDLYLLSQAITQAMLNGTTPEAGPLPAWSVPPAKVLEPVREAKPAVAAPAATIAQTPAAAPVATSVLPPASPPSTSPVSPPSATSSASALSAAPKTGGSSVGVPVPAGEFTDAKISADSAGQWAASAVAGSQYGKTQYSAAQATGAPNIAVAGNSPDAWCPASKSSGTDWLEVTFAKPVHATEVRVRQNDAAGAIVKVEAMEPNGTSHVWWEGLDPYPAPATREIAWFAVRVPPTDYLVAKIKLTLDLSLRPGWKEIDAVQLVGAGN